MNPRAPSPYWSFRHLQQSVRWFIKDSKLAIRDLLVPTEVSVISNGVSINPSRVEPGPSHLKAPTRRSVRQLGRSVRQANSKEEVV
jgi:hypothetical protein